MRNILRKYSYGTIRLPKTRRRQTVAQNTQIMAFTTRQSVWIPYGTWNIRIVLTENMTRRERRNVPSQMLEASTEVVRACCTLPWDPTMRVPTWNILHSFMNFHTKGIVAINGPNVANPMSLPKLLIIHPLSSFLAPTVSLFRIFLSKSRSEGFTMISIFVPSGSGCIWKNHPCESATRTDLPVSSPNASSLFNL